MNERSQMVEPPGGMRSEIKEFAASWTCRLMQMEQFLPCRRSDKCCNRSHKCRAD